MAMNLKFTSIRLPRIEWIIALQRTFGSHQARLSPVRNAIGAAGVKHDGGPKGLGSAGLESTGTRRVLPLPRDGPGVGDRAWDPGLSVGILGVVAGRAVCAEA